MQRLPKGILINLETITGLPKSRLCDYLNDRVSMTKKRAIWLEKQTLPYGSFFTRENWMFYPKKIKQALINHPLVFTKFSSQDAA